MWTLFLVLCLSLFGLRDKPSAQLPRAHPYVAAMAASSPVPAIPTTPQQESRLRVAARQIVSGGSAGREQAVFE